jgi:cellulose synthase operon protein C
VLRQLFRLRLVAVITLIAGLVSACSLDPNARKQKYFEDGEAFFQKGNYNAAATEYAKAIKVDPDYADAHFQLAESYLFLQQSDPAYQEFSRTVELRPNDFRARLEMANLLITNRSFAQAKEQTDLLLKQRPNDPAVHSAVASLLAAQDDIPGAIEETQRSIALDPGQWGEYLSLALLQLKAGQPDAAEADFKKVIAMNPKEVRARVLLGIYYESAGRVSDAEEQFREGIASAPAAMAPREALAKLYLVEGRGNDAENVLEQASRDLPNDPDCLLALSNFYFLTGNTEKAVATYKRLLVERPGDLSIKKKYIQLLIQTERYDEARDLVNEILKANAEDGDALVYRSEMQINEGDLSDAVRTLQTVITNAPNDGLAHYAMGVALNKQGYPDRAASEWRQALNLNPNLLEAQRALADSAMLKGDMNALQDAANQMIRLEPQSPEGYALRALSNINRGQFDAAERDVHRAIDVAPQNAFGYVQLGNLKLAQKQYSDAAQAYQEALDRNAGSTDALRGLVNSYIAERQVDKAIAAAKAQISKSPTSGSFYEILGATQFRFAKDPDGAEIALQRSVGLNPKNEGAVMLLCQVEAAKGEFDQAIATAEQSLKQTPRQPNLDILMGSLYESQSDWKQAEDAYHAALNVDPQNPVASNDLARVMVDDGGNIETALSLAQSARQSSPESPAVFDTLGWIYYHQGMYELAVNSLQQALSLEEKHQMPDNPDIHYHLGMAYEKTKQMALARENFEHVLKTNPNYPSAAQIKAELTRLKS